MSIALLLSLASAVAYGLSDFVGGSLARRTSAWAVSTMSQLTATLLTAAFVAVDGGELDLGTAAWGIAAGAGSGVGNVYIYRGLAAGRMAVVAPVSAIAAVAMPVLVGTIAGERPGAIATIGVLIALPAIWLVSGGRGWQSLRDADTVNGLIAGAGFGVQFSALGQIPTQAGLLPLAVSQAASVAAIIAGASVLSAAWIPRDRPSHGGAVAGLLAGIATICYQLATQRGLLTIAAVVASLYPAVTVMLAAIVLRERIRRGQYAGLMLAAAAIALIAAR